MVPIIEHMEVIPVAGYDSPLLNLAGLHEPFFTRNIVVLTDSRGYTGLGEVPAARPSPSVWRAASRSSRASRSVAASRCCSPCRSTSRT